MQKRLLKVLNYCSDNQKSKIQNRKWVGLFAIVLALTSAGVRVEAQQSTKIPRIGYLSPTSPSISPTRIEAFRQGRPE
jgi:hypothetical protein